MKGHAEGHAEGLAEGLTKGLAKGLTKGRDERNLEIARKMKSRGMSFDEIAEMTDLTVDEIEKL
jgi:predicted transposase/invertase (TIGR01784 family)